MLREQHETIWPGLKRHFPNVLKLASIHLADITKEWSPKRNRTRHVFLLTSPARPDAESVFALGCLFEK